MKRDGQAVADHGGDLDLVRRLLAGDQAAFETFGELSFRALYRFALHRLDGDRELARDLTQTTLVKVLPKLATYRGEAALLTWLCACCRNEIRMHRRREASRPRQVALEDAASAAALEVATAEAAQTAPGVAPPRPEGPEAALVRRQAAQRVHLALDALPEHYARALEWKYLDRLPVRQIAWRLRLRPKAAESLLTRARGAFRKIYDALSDAVPEEDGRTTSHDGEERTHGKAGRTSQHGRAAQPA